jgi:uncharacterized protein YyaL (SSP411 family)
VWTEAEVDAVLGAESAFFKQQYDVSAGGNWEGHTILNRSQRPAMLDAACEERLAKAREKLLAARAGRHTAGLGRQGAGGLERLMIAGAGRGGNGVRAAGLAGVGGEAFRFIRATMMKDGRLFHAWRAGKLQHAATLDDHAHLATAALALLRGDRRRRTISIRPRGADGAARRAFLGQGGGRLFHDRRRREGRDPASEIRR